MRHLRVLRQIGARQTVRTNADLAPRTLSTFATCATATLPMLRAFRCLTLSLLRAGRALALRLVSGRLRLRSHQRIAGVAPGFPPTEIGRH